MQIDSSAYDPPCCRSRLAISRLQLLTLAAACVLLWSTPASSQPSPATSDAQLAGPASRLQQRHAGQLRTLGELPAIEPETILRVAAEWTDAFSQISLALLQDQSLNVQPVAAEEEIATGEPEEDPCFVSLPLSDVSVSIAAPDGKLPDDLAAECRERISPRGDSRLYGGWAVFDKHWAATCMHHRPLYFEEVNAERYGYTPESRLSTIHLCRPLRCHDSSTALPDGGSPTVPLHLHPGPLSPRRLRPLSLASELRCACGCWRV